MLITALISLLFVLEPEVIESAPKPPAAPTVVTEDAPPKVELISTGEEPRAKTRLALKVGDVQSVVMEMDMQMKMATGGEERPSPVMPIMIMNFSVTVDEELPAGGWKYHFEFVGIDVRAKEGSPPQLATMMKAMLGDMVGTRIDAEVDSIGRQKRFEVRTKSTNPMLLQQFDSMKQSMSQMAAVFPEEAIGPGAEWATESRTKFGGIRTRQRVKFRLISRTDNDIKMAVSLQQWAAEKNSAMENLPAGAIGTLVDLVSDGKGEMDASLTRVMPRRARMSVESVANMDIETQGVKTKMDTHTTMSMTMRTAPPEAESKPRP